MHHAMRGVLGAVMVLLAAAPAQAQPSPPPAADTIRLATWNIQTLTTGKPVFDKQDYLRKPADIALLREFAARIPADVIALQEIASPAAAAQIFPLDRYAICISGQFFASYPALGSSGARCYDDGPLPDTPADEKLARQFTAFAVWKKLGARLVPTDLAEIGVDHRDGSDNVVRPTRWALALEVTRGNHKVALLNVHLKTGCFTQPLVRKPRPEPSTNSCETFSKQIPVLDAFMRKQSIPLVVLGDFNRYLDLSRDAVFERLAGLDTRTDPADDTGITRAPERRPSFCFVEPRAEYYYVPIDYFVLSKGLQGRDFREHVPRIPRGKDPKAFKQAFGDHCPKSLAVGLSVKN